MTKRKRVEGRVLDSNADVEFSFGQDMTGKTVRFTSDPPDIWDEPLTLTNIMAPTLRIPFWFDVRPHRFFAEILS